MSLAPSWGIGLSSGIQGQKSLPILPIFFARHASLFCLSIYTLYIRGREPLRKEVQDGSENTLHSKQGAIL